MDPEEKEKMEKRDWLTERIQMLNTQLEGFEADVEKAVRSKNSTSTKQKQSVLYQYEVLHCVLYIQVVLLVLILILIVISDDLPSLPLRVQYHLFSDIVQDLLLNINISTTRYCVIPG